MMELLPNETKNCLPSFKGMNHKSEHFMCNTAYIYHPVM